MSWKVHEVLCQPRQSVRLKGYDCSQAGAYFVTICTHDRACLFGEVVNGAVPFNEYGAKSEQFWLDMPRHWPHLVLDAFVFMPNHVHGIVVIMPTNIGARHTVGARGHVPLRRGNNGANRYQV